MANRDGNLTFRLLLPIVRGYIPDQRGTKKLCRDLLNLMDRCPRGNNLYSICVSKEKFDERCYFSIPLGVPLTNQKDFKNKMEEMQSGTRNNSPPQFQILTHKIRPRDGLHVIVNSTLTNNQPQKIEDEVSLCIQAVLTGYRIKKSPKKPFYIKCTQNLYNIFIKRLLNSC